MKTNGRILKEDDCGICLKSVKDGEEGLCCDACDLWFHRLCCKVTPSAYKVLNTDKLPWFCGSCRKTAKAFASNLKDLKDDIVYLQDKVASLEDRIQELESKNNRAPIRDTNESWASVASHKDKMNIANLARVVQKENKDRRNREKNLIIYGTKPGETENDDKILVNVIADKVGVVLSGVQVETKRLGKVRDNGIQLLRVKMTVEKKREILDNAKKLSLSDLRNVYVSRDRTPEEQKLDYELRVQLRTKRAENPDKTFFIRRGKIVEKQE